MQLDARRSVVLGIFFASCAIQLCWTANLVAIGIPMYSHVITLVNVGEVLQRQGHNVTVAVPAELQHLVVDKGLNALLYDSAKGFVADFDKIITDVIHKALRGECYDSQTRDLLTKYSERIANDEGLHKALLDIKPDMLIFEWSVPSGLLPTITCTLQDVPFVFIGQTMYGQFARVPLLTTTVPGRQFVVTNMTDQMTFRQRLTNSVSGLLLHYYIPMFSNEVVGRLCPNRPGASLQEIYAKASLWIEAHDGILDYNKPTMPNIKQVSNLLPMQPLKGDLPPKLQKFMDNGKTGVVIVSFGSLFTSIPFEYVEKMVQAFKLTSYSYVIRYPTTNFSDSQILSVDGWMPQLDLLCHNNTRLFLTHCGVKGQQEAIYAGVPMLGFPLALDQHYNAARMVRKGFGLRLDIRTFTVEGLASAIKEVITNSEYKARTKKASTIVRAARVPPVEEAAFWINHVLTFGDEHLRSLAQDVPLWKYLGLDILAFCFLIWHILLFLVIKATFAVINRCCRGKGKFKSD